MGLHVGRHVQWIVNDDQQLVGFRDRNNQDWLLNGVRIAYGTEPAPGDTVVTGAGPGASIAEYATFADLPVQPVAAGTTAIVYQATGIIWINRQKAGLYRSDGAAWIWLGETPEGYFTDNVLTFFDNADITKQGAFELSTVTTGNKRTISWPDATGVMALVADITAAIGALTKASVGLANVDNTSDANKPVSTAQQTALNLKANLASPTFTGTVSGVTATMVGLGNVNNTSDAAKPVSTAQQTALDLKANLASPTFTGTVGGITKAMVGLANVDNTSDANKPVSTAQQTALNLKLDATHAGTGGAAHANVVAAGAAGFMTGADKTKLDGVATGATANSSDATLLARANHTGTQLASTISDFAEATDDRVAALLVQGTNVTLVYNDAANTLTVNSTATGGGAVAVNDEGVPLTAAVTSLDFVGAGVTATNTLGAVTVTIPGGGGGSGLTSSQIMARTTGNVYW